jgi:hypothetical protein
MSTYEELMFALTVLVFLFGFLSLCAALYNSWMFHNSNESIRSWIVPFFVAPFVVWNVERLDRNAKSYRGRAIRAWLSTLASLVLAFVTIFVGLEMPP